MDVIEKIKSFAELKDGWSFGEGKPIQPDVIDAAIEFAERAARNGVPEMNAFPGLCGEVMLTIYRQAEYWEFILHEDGKAAYAYEVEDELLDYQENLSLEDAHRLIDEHFHGDAPQIHQRKPILGNEERINEEILWFSSGSSILDTTILRKSDSSVLRLKIQPAAEYRSLIKSVR